MSEIAAVTFFLLFVSVMTSLGFASLILRFVAGIKGDGRYGAFEYGLGVVTAIIIFVCIYPKLTGLMHLAETPSVWTQRALQYGHL